VGHGVIDGDHWIRRRLAFLSDALKTELTDEQRKAVEDEIERLTHERGIHIGGRRRWWFPSRWIGPKGPRDEAREASETSETAESGGPGEPSAADPHATGSGDQPQPNSSSRASDIPK
jgi:hypothetical protein